VNIELKSYETGDKVVDLIEHFADKYWNYNQFIVSSFDWNALQQVVFFESAIRIGVFRRKFRFGFGFRNLFRRSIHPDYHLLTAENTAKLQEAKFSPGQ
jgi:glycerophosphoryl diester phosphodiesterase